MESSSLFLGPARVPFSGQACWWPDKRSSDRIDRWRHCVPSSPAFAAVAERAGPTGVSLHTLRHSTASALIASEAAPQRALSDAPQASIRSRPGR